MSRLAPLFTEQKYLNPIWMLRGLSVAATMLVSIAFLNEAHAVLRNSCIGAALGLLATFSIFCFTGIERVVLKETPQPSDVTDLRIT